MTLLKSRAAAVSGAILLLLAVGAGAQTRTAAREVGKRVIEPFDYRGVTLEDGPLRSQFDEVRFDYLRIPPDALLKGFRKRAGLPAPGADLGGWYSTDTFHVFGQILSGLARMYAATGDPACRARAELLVGEWEKCIAPDGFFYFSKTPNAPHYTYEKIVGGLVDMIVYCDSARARKTLSRITGWAEKNLSRKRGYAFNSEAGDTEWYTLSENLYRAYLATGDTRYRDFAAVWEYTEYWDIYGRKGDIFGKRPNGLSTGGYHAYSHVNTLSGLGAAYLAKGDKRYLQTLVNAYDSLQSTQCFATGGYGPNELLAPRDALLKMLGETHNTFETQCGSWAGFKVSKYLVSCTGDARYGDWIERLVYNGIGASISMTPDGKVFYYSDYNTGGAYKKNIDTAWTCCTGTRPMAVADYHDLIYFHNRDTLFVNLYTPSTVRWNRSSAGGARTMTVSQQTSFPEQDTTRFTVHGRDPSAFTLAFRAPEWLAAPVTAAVNGKAVSLMTGRDHWLRLNRKWKEGDIVSLKLPMRLRAQSFNPGKPNPMAVLYGPVALAFDASKSNPTRLLAAGDITQRLQPVPGAPLEFRVPGLPGGGEVRARPFYRYNEDEPYILYIDSTAPNRIGYRRLTYSDGWNDSGSFKFINKIGATVEGTFEGTGVKWLGSRFDDAGQAEVRIDGMFVAVVDQYGPGRDLPFEWVKTGLPPGKHTIKLTLLPEKSSDSKDHYINVGGFEGIEN